VGTGASRTFTSYTTGPRIYEYDVTYHGVSPYVHGEISPLDALRITAGVRFDHLGYDFDNHYEAMPIAVSRPFPGLRYYGQAADTDLTYDHVTPKFGATYAFNADTHLYLSYNQGFRVPSESQLFRPSATASPAAADALTQSALALKPIQADQAEVGVRGNLGVLAYDAVVYDLEKRDDIVTLRDTATNFTQTVNAGRTRHRGIEIGVGLPLARTLRWDAALSYATHEYVEWKSAGGDFSGKEIESAPRVLVNTRLTWTPREALEFQLEWVRVGSYWLDAANTTKYGGHDLVNLRVHWSLDERIALFGSINNVADTRYADMASITSNTPVYSPGLPRTFVAGAEFKW
jgi:outer membrane receptor protein involved in Fe transport